MEGAGASDSVRSGGLPKALFGMFGGEKTRVTLEVSNKLAGVLIDRFGKRDPHYTGWGGSFQNDCRSRAEQHIPSVGSRPSVRISRLSPGQRAERSEAASPRIKRHLPPLKTLYAGVGLQTDAFLFTGRFFGHICLYNESIKTP